MLTDIFRHRELIMRLVKRDLKVRYKSSVLGFLWSIAKPLLLVAIYTFVFDKVLRVPFGTEEIPYALLIMAGLIPWMFFASAVGESTHCILANASLIKKVKLPHEVFPISVVLGNLIHFLLAMVVLIAFMAWLGIWLTWEALWLIPLIGLLTLLTIAFALLLSSLNVFYRDIASAFEIVFVAWMYATPIIYPLHLAAGRFGLGNGGAGVTSLAGAGGVHFPSWLFQVYMLNPLTPLTTGFRRALLCAPKVGPNEVRLAPEYTHFIDKNPDLWLVGQLAISAAVILILLVIGAAVFRHYSRFFADEV